MFIEDIWCLHFRTKIFIRFPRVLFATEDALGLKKQELGKK